MNRKKLLIPALIAYLLFISACVYIVVPEGVEKPVVNKDAASLVWNALVTRVGPSETGDLRIEVTIRNDTGDWARMESAAGKPAVLAGADGKKVDCATVFVGTGGHRLAPGFQMRGYTTGKGDAAAVQLLYIECAGVSNGAGSTLTIDYLSYGGILDDYEPLANRKEGKMTLNLDEITSDLTYPIAGPVEGLIQESGVEIIALSDNLVTLQDVQRTESGLEFTWQNFNPTKFALKTHIGNPPVIGADGIIYGAYEILDMPSVPITPAGESMQWTTKVTVPQDVSNLYILLSVESNKPRTYKNYALDISDK